MFEFFLLYSYMLFQVHIPKRILKILITLLMQDAVVKTSCLINRTEED